MQFQTNLIIKKTLCDVLQFISNVQGNTKSTEYAPFYSELDRKFFEYFELTS